MQGVNMKAVSAKVETFEQEYEVAAMPEYIKELLPARVTRLYKRVLINIELIWDEFAEEGVERVYIKFDSPLSDDGLRWDIGESEFGPDEVDDAFVERIRAMIG
jgi:hypothetical protein